MDRTATTTFAHHPCFNPEAKGKYGRVHLPVAPKCNIKCNFCDRRYDCVNESRPGVTSTVLTPDQARIYLDRVVTEERRITVAGIAGPGDPFANPEETMATLRTIHEAHPHIMLCVSSNGMGIGPYIDELAELNVTHVTITVCAVDPVIGARIYAWVRDGKVVYRGEQAATLLLGRQLAAIEKLKSHGILVKVNCIVIPTINEHHIEEVACTVRERDADLFNCMAMFPNVNTPFADLGQPNKENMEEIRRRAEKHLPQMRHCTRCRADAVGLLDEDRTREFRSCLSECAATPPPPQNEPAQRPYVAVASREGVLINSHLGETKEFSIWGVAEKGDVTLMETRPAPAAGGGMRRWHQLGALLGDCRAVLCCGVGDKPREVLDKLGIEVVEAAGLIDEGVRTIFAGRPRTVLKGRKSPCATGTCSGSGGGCL